MLMLFLDLGWQVELDEAGYVLVKEGSVETSVDGVFAAGDLQVRMSKGEVAAAGTGGQGGYAGIAGHLQFTMRGF